MKKLISLISASVVLAVMPAVNAFALSVGDINGDKTIDSTDASGVLLAYAYSSTNNGKSNLTPNQRKAADVNKDGTIDASDASKILQYYAYSSTGGNVTFEYFLAHEEEFSKPVTVITSEMYKDAYKALIKKMSYDKRVTNMSYALYDMNKDEIPEIIIKYGTCEADYRIGFVTYKDNGLAVLGDNFSGAHVGFYVDRSVNNFCTKWGQMGTGGIRWYSYYGNAVSEYKVVNDIYYGTSSDDPFAAYGDFEELGSISCYYYSSNKKWTSYRGDNSTDGIDLSLIDEY